MVHIFERHESVGDSSPHVVPKLFAKLDGPSAWRCERLPVADLSDCTPCVNCHGTARTRPAELPGCARSSAVESFSSSGSSRNMALRFTIEDVGGLTPLHQRAPERE